MGENALLDQVKQEISASLKPVFEEDPSLKKVFDNICEPEQVHRWKAVWEDDKGEKHINTCWRVQQNGAIGPYKGGLRFDPSVTLDVLRFLALEQTFKNALTGKAMGGGKGGSDFDPKGKSDNELRRFCEAFMLGLHKYIGPDTDVPAGDIGVNGKTIGYLYGFWRKLGNPHNGTLSGKSILFGGSQIRTEATGYGVIYLLLEHLKHTKDEKEETALKGKKVLISGSGNVATFCAKKAISFGAHVLSMSDRKQTYWSNNDSGMSEEDVDGILDYKSGKNKSLPKDISTVSEKPWSAQKTQIVDIAIPCATQNEIDDKDVEALIARKCSIVIEGSNLSSTGEAVEAYKKNYKEIDYIGSKLANLGGVGTSFLEMQQNSSKQSWQSEKVDEELHEIMRSAYTMSKNAAEKYSVSLTDGANIAAFLKVSDAMRQLGYA